MISPVQSNDLWRQSMGVPEVWSLLRWEGLIEKVGFEPGVRVKEWWMLRVVMMTKMGWQVDEEVNREETGSWRNESGSYINIPLFLPVLLLVVLLLVDCDFAVTSLI